MIGWIYLALAIGFEVGAATCLKLSRGIPGVDENARVLPFALMLAFYIICFVFMSKSLETILNGVNHRKGLENLRIIDTRWRMRRIRQCSLK